MSNATQLLAALRARGIADEDLYAAAHEGAHGLDVEAESWRSEDIDARLMRLSAAQRMHAEARAHDLKCRAAQRETAKHPQTELEKLQDLLTNQEETLADWQDDTAIATPSEIKQLKTLITATRAAIAQATKPAPTLADRIAARYPGIASHVEIVRPTPYTDAPTQETPPAIRVSTSRPIASTMTDRTPAGYGPAQPSLF